MPVKRAFVSSLLAVAFLVSGFAKVSATQELSSPLISTLKYWEARLSSVQYAEITKQEDSGSQIVLKGDAPSSAFALVVTCTALQDMQFTNVSLAVSHVPDVALAGGFMSHDVVVGVVTTPMSAVRFQGMMVVHSPKPTAVYLGGLTAKKGQTLTVLFAYGELSLKKTPNDLSLLTIHSDQMTQDIRVPIPWRVPAVKPRRK